MNRARVEALWREQPYLTQREVRRITGAPWSTVRRVYTQLIAVGVIAPRPQVWTALDLAWA